MMLRSVPLLFLFLFMSSAQAAPIQWNVDIGTAFFDGSSLTGSFFYDASTDTYSDVSLSTSAGIMITCVAPGIPGDEVCDGFGPIEPVDGFSFDRGVALHTDVPEPNMFGFLSDDFAAGQTRALFLNFLGVELVSGTVNMEILEWHCVPGCEFDVESSTFRSGSGSVTAVPVPWSIDSVCNRPFWPLDRLASSKNILTYLRIRSLNEEHSAYVLSDFRPNGIALGSRAGVRAKCHSQWAH